MTARMALQYTASFFRFRERHLTQGSSVEAHSLEPRALSYFPFKVHKRLPSLRLQSEAAVGVLLGLATPLLPVHPSQMGSG